MENEGVGKPYFLAIAIPPADINYLLQCLAALYCIIPNIRIELFSIRDLVIIILRVLNVCQLV